MSAVIAPVFIENPDSNQSLTKSRAFRSKFKTQCIPEPPSTLLVGGKLWYQRSHTHFPTVNSSHSFLVNHTSSMGCFVVCAALASSQDLYIIINLAALLSKLFFLSLAVALISFPSFLLALRLPPLFLSVSVSVSLSVCLSVSLSLPHTHTHTLPSL